MAKNKSKLQAPPSFLLNRNSIKIIIRSESVQVREKDIFKRLVKGQPSKERVQVTNNGQELFLRPKTKALVALLKENNNSKKVRNRTIAHTSTTSTYGW